MEQTGEYLVQAPREEVWRALNDPDILGACIAGCEEVTRVDETHFDMRIKAKIGPVSARFAAVLELSNVNPPESYVISGSVKGGAAGFAKGDAQVNLANEDLANERGATRLTYTVNASVGGKLAQVGSRLVDSAARKMAEDFFAAFANHLGTSEAATETQRAAADAQGVAPEDDADTSVVAAKSNNDQWKIWAIAFAVLLAALLLSI